jgi:hypothetical protein
MTATKQARLKGEEAGSRCVASTERDVPDWGEQALHYLRWFFKIKGTPRAKKYQFGIFKGNWCVYTAEEIRKWSYDKGLPPAKDDRAFGPVIAKAIRDGLIVKAGYAPTVSSNGSVRATYRRAS